MDGKKQRFIVHKCINNVYHINLNGKTNTKTVINISTYIPDVIKHLVQSIPDKFNEQYIICPYYKKFYDYQIGITETIKKDESVCDAIIRGVNEECGLYNFKWYNKIQINDSRQWTGVIINNEQYEFKPHSTHNNNKDTQNKVAVILYDNLYKILKKFKNLKFGDIDSDNISGIGLISVHDCKQLT